MIKVILSKNSNDISKITITGHANFDDYGKDIVCAAVSSTVITSVNILLSLDSKSIKYDDKNGLVIDVLKNDITVDKIVNVLIDNLYKLSKTYPSNIQIKEENNE